MLHYECFIDERAMEERELDVVVLGATGFSGVLVVKFLLKTNDIKWGIAGRSIEKVTNLLKSLDNDGANKNIPTFIVDVNDKDSLRKTAVKAKIILNCVGPNTILSGQIVEACIESRTHYIDISAEINHILDIYRQYHKAAEDANVLIIPSCGFSSLPAASGLLYLDDEFEGTLNSVECYMELGIPKRAYFPWPGNCLVHYGTWESMVHVIMNLKEYTRLKKETFPEPIGVLPREMDRNFFHCNRGKLWFPYPGPEEDVIEFSERYMSDYQNKRPVHFKIYTTMPLWIHFFIIPFLYLYYYLCYFKCFNTLLRKYPRLFTLGYMSHKGPTEKMMKSVTYSFSYIGKGWDRSLENHTLPTNKTLKCKVSSSDGYRGTAVAMVISGVTLLKDRLVMPKGGVINIGAAFRGTKLVERLANNGFTFEIIQ